MVEIALLEQVVDVIQAPASAIYPHYRLVSFSFTKSQNGCGLFKQAFESGIKLNVTRVKLVHYNFPITSSHYSAYLATPAVTGFCKVAFGSHRRFRATRRSCEIDIQELQMLFVFMVVALTEAAIDLSKSPLSLLDIFSRTIIQSLLDDRLFSTLCQAESLVQHLAGPNVLVQFDHAGTTTQDVEKSGLNFGEGSVFKAFLLNFELLSHRAEQVKRFPFKSQANQASFSREMRSFSYVKIIQGITSFLLIDLRSQQVRKVIPFGWLKATQPAFSC
jgi:hypothetical protein